MLGAAQSGGQARGFLVEAMRQPQSFDDAQRLFVQQPALEAAGPHAQVCSSSLPAGGGAEAMLACVTVSWVTVR